MEIKRDYYLNKLIMKRHNGLIKVVTGYAVVENLICFLLYLKISLWRMR